MSVHRLATLTILALTFSAFGQNGDFTFKTEPRSAFIWGADFSAGAVSSILKDPLTGYALHKLSYSGIEVSAQLGFERIGRSIAGDLLNYTTVISNGTDIDIPVRYGGCSIDGHTAPPLSVAIVSKSKSKHDRKDVWELGKMQCFTSGFLPRENVFSNDVPSKVFMVGTKHALVVSAVVKDPRHYGIRCSVEGCYPTGTTRYYINVNGKDYIFVWNGRSAVDCGE
jgi:hypothetical protein